MEVYISKLLKLCSFMAILLAVAGLSYNIIYYRVFDIYITDFIDLSESLMLFFPKLRIIGGFIVGYSLSYTLYWIFLKDHNSNKRVWLIFSLFITGGIAVYFFIFEHLLGYLCVFGLLIFPHILQIALQWIKRKFNLQLPRYFNFTFYISFSFVILSLIFSYFSAVNVKRTKKYRYVEVVSYNDAKKSLDTMVIDNTKYVYFGQTKNYLFIYNRGENSSQVYGLSKMVCIKYLQ